VIEFLFFLFFCIRGLSRSLFRLLRETSFSKSSLLYSTKKKKTKLRGLSPQANYTDRATAVCWRSLCQILRVEGVEWSAQRIPTAVNLGFLDRCYLLPLHLYLMNAFGSISSSILEICSICRSLLKENDSAALVF
jgi:hypothetical protein